MEPTGRRAVLVAAVAVALVAGVVLAIGKAASYARLAHELRHAQAGWLALCLAGEILAYAGYLVAYRETAAVDGGPRYSRADALRVVAAGFGSLAIATGAGPIAVDYWALTHVGVRAREAAARVIAINTLEWTVLTAATVPAALALGAGAERGAPLAAVVPWAVVVPLCFAAALWVTASERYGRLAADEGGRLRRLFAACVRGVRLVRLLPWQAFAGTAVYWLGDLLCLWGALRAFGITLGPAALLFGYATGYLVALLPLPAGGAGGVDAALTYALTLVHVPLAPALLAALAFRLFNFWLPVVPALAVLPTLGRIERRDA